MNRTLATLLIIGACIGSALCQAQTKDKAVTSVEGTGKKVEWPDWSPDFDPATVTKSKKDYLDGAEVMVRVYRTPKRDPSAYDLVPLTVKRNKLELGELNATEEAVIAVVGEEQQDALVRRNLSNRLYAWPYAETLSMRIPLANTPSVSMLSLRDALGNDIVGGTVQVYLAQYNGPPFNVSDVIKQGSFDKLQSRQGMDFFEYVLDHPDYGLAVSPRPIRRGSHISFPLVPRTSPAAERAIRGVVLDPDGYPIEGARISCRYVRTMGEGLINAEHESSAALTDASGHFSLYITPTSQFSEQRGQLIPPKSKYYVRIEAREHPDLLPFVGDIENTGLARIVMESAGRAHSLVFLDEVGIVDDPTGLQQITLMVDRGETGRLTLGYEDFKARMYFPNGTYRAEIPSGWRQKEYGERIQTDPVEVTDDSPFEIVHRIPEPVVYTGQVVDGVTGEPFAGAYVINMYSSSSKRLADITPAEWAKIHALDDDIDATDPAVKPINEAFGVVALARTDAQGYYSLQPQPGRGFYTFLAFDEHYIPVSKRVSPQKPGTPREVVVDTLKMFPAAKIMVKVCVDEEHVSIQPKWIVDKDASSAWIDDLLDFDDGRTSFIRSDGWIEQNEAQYVFVPADCALRLQLRMPYDEQWSPFTTEDMFRLSHGQVLDIGEVELQPSLKVYVLVTDSDGMTVEGVPVRKRTGNRGSVAHNTDEHGRVMFYIPPHSQGRFYVTNHKRTADGHSMIEELPFRVAGQEDDDGEFVLKLSDEILSHLFDD